MKKCESDDTCCHTFLDTASFETIYLRDLHKALFEIEEDKCAAYGHFELDGLFIFRTLQEIKLCLDCRPFQLLLVI